MSYTYPVTKMVQEIISTSPLVVHGYFSSQFALAKEPILGKWEILASIPSRSENQREIKSFFVQEYGKTNFQMGTESSAVYVLQYDEKPVKRISALIRMNGNFS